MNHVGLLYRITTCLGILVLITGCGGSDADEIEALRREVGEVKQAQEELKRSLAELQNTVANLPGAKFLANAKAAQSGGTQAAAAKPPGAQAPAAAPAPAQQAAAQSPDGSKREAVRLIPIGMAPRKGSEFAPIVVVQFADFQCPDCKAAVKLSDELVAAYPREVQFVFKHNPLPRHRDAERAAKAAWAAHQQGKFWEMHDAIFAGDIERIDDEMLRRYAQQIGLDMARFETDMASPAADQAVKADRRLALAMKVGGVPVYYVNGRRVLDRSPAGVRAKVEEQIAQRKQQPAS